MEHKWREDSNLLKQVAGSCSSSGGALVEIEHPQIKLWDKWCDLSNTYKLTLIALFSQNKVSGIWMNLHIWPIWPLVQSASSLDVCKLQMSSESAHSSLKRPVEGQLEFFWEPKIRSRLKSWVRSKLEQTRLFQERGCFWVKESILILKHHIKIVLKIDQYQFIRQNLNVTVSVWSACGCLLMNGSLSKTSAMQLKQNDVARVVVQSFL